MRTALLLVLLASSIAAQPEPAPQSNADVTFHSAPAALAPAAVTSDWPSLLGPTHNEVSPETNLIHEFPNTGPKLVWEMKKGEGYASPAILGRRLVLFHRIKDQEVIDCLDAETGGRFWQFKYPTAYEDEYGYCNGPRASAVIGGDAVFAIGAEGKLHCLELASGKLRWQHDLKREYKLKQNFFGVGSTPLVDSDKLVVNVGADGGPCVVAFSVRDGSVAWTCGTEWGPSYASPVPADFNGKPRVLVFAGGRSNPPTGGLMCIDPANGKADFSFPWRGTVRESVNASSPLVLGNRVFISECYGSGSTLMEIGKDFQPQTAWTNPEFGVHFMTPIVKDGYLYAVDGHGPEDAFLACVDLKTGKQVWRTQPQWEETIIEEGGPRKIGTGIFRCWLMPVDGRVLCLGEFGHLLWVDLSPKGYKETSRAWLFAGGESWTPLVLSRGLLYICQNAPDRLHHTGRRLLCYDLRAAR